MFKRWFKTKPNSPAVTARQCWWLFAAASASLLPLLNHIPVWLSLTAGLGMLWRGWLNWHAYRTPPKWLLMLLVIAGGGAVWSQYHSLFGRNPGLALLVIFLVLKLLELRSCRDGVSVILLGLFLLQASFFFSQSMASAVLTLAACIIVIGALAQLQSGNSTPLRQQCQQAALMLVQALPFMLVLFVLFPRVQGPLWGLPQDAFTATSGLSEKMRPGSISALARSDAIAFRARFEGKPPAPQDMYWRGLTLSDYDGLQWQYRSTPELSALPYTPQGKPLSYVITLEASNQRWLFALEQAGLLPPDTSISTDGMILTRDPIRSRLQYNMQSYPPATGTLKESPRILAAALKLPSDTNPKARALAESWRQQGLSDAQILARAIEFFEGQLLGYTLTPPLMLENSVDAFLFEHKRGFCEHFASAFAFVMRAAGVPARVIGGYQGGEINPVDGYLTVRQYDAHAWNEVWIAKRGWVRVDPTALNSPDRIQAGVSNALQDNTPLPLMARADYAWLRDMRFRFDAVSNAWNQYVLAYNPQRQKQVLEELGMPEPDWRKMTAWLSALCGSLLLALTAFALHSRNTSPLGQRTWQKFVRKLQNKGVAIAPWMGADTVAALAVAQMPQHAIAIRDIAATYIALRYAQSSASHSLHHFTQQVSRFKP